MLSWMQGREGCGSLFESSWGGTQQVQLQGGVSRTFLEDGDTVIMHGSCGEGEQRVGFGECRATLLPAIGS